MSQSGSVNTAAFWMPFTANRQFKAEPRLLVGAEGMHYTTEDGRTLLDGTAGLWCVNAGHGRANLTRAVHDQLERLDYGPTFQMGHPAPFELAERLVRHTPQPLNKVFFTNSGSEAVDTALKIALAYQRARGEGQRTRLIGREKGYHGVGFGGISVGGLVNNRRVFGPGLPGADHLRHTLLPQNAFSRGIPDQGAELAEDLERLIALHGDTIAAVIVEPVAGSAGVVLPPAGYLRRLREITREHGILLIFDEVITGFGRVGEAFAASRFGVTPDLITAAKGLTNGAIPMGAVFAADFVHDAFMDGPEAAIELFHGYTYSGHPVAAAAGLASLDIYESEGLFQRALELEGRWEEALHALAELPNVRDIRNIGLVGAVEFEPRDGQVGARGYDVFHHCYWQGNVLVRCTGDTIALSPPLIIEEDQIDELMAALKAAILAVN